MCIRDRSYVESGNYAWNSGMFVWKASTILKKFERLLPDIYECLVKIGDAMNTCLLYTSNFVTRKITLAAGRIACGIQDHLELGNMDSLRDWGYAKDYVECMWLMLQHETPEDFVIATGEQHTVRDFTERAFKAVGIDLRWEGTGIDEKGYDVKTGKMLVRCV